MKKPLQKELKSTILCTIDETIRVSNPTFWYVRAMQDSDCEEVGCDRRRCLRVGLDRGPGSYSQARGDEQAARLASVGVLFIDCELLRRQPRSQEPTTRECTTIIVITPN
jgi:hypothetical protein